VTVTTEPGLLVMWIHVSDCSSLSAPTNGNIEYTCSYEGCTALFDCDTGYELIGQSLITCLDTGWSHSEPTCQVFGKIKVSF